MKTKIGLSVGVASAIMYALGLLGIVPALLAAGYILIAEQDKSLRRSAIVTLSVVLAVAVVVAIFGVMGYVFDWFNTIIAWFDTSFRLKYPGDFDNLFKIAAYLLRDVFFLVMIVVSLCRTGSLKKNIGEMAGTQDGEPKDVQAVSAEVTAAEGDTRDDA